MDTTYHNQSSTGSVNNVPTESNTMSKFQGTMMILLLCIGLALVGWYTFEISAGFDEQLQTAIGRIDAVSEKINAPIQWEYRIESFPDRSFDQRINTMGSDGWELVFARRASDGSDYSPTFSYEMIFKRPKKIDTGHIDKEQKAVKKGN